MLRMSKIDKAEITYSVRLLHRIYDDQYNGVIEDLEIEFALTELGNTVPLPGDCVVAPWVSGNFSDPANRKIYEVKERYVMPESIDESKGGHILYCSDSPRQVGV